MFKPESVIIAWDGRMPQFRRDKVPTYKANRKKDDTYDDFLRQLSELDEILVHTGTVNVRRHGIEADDYIYQAAFLAQGKYDRIVIISNDQDLYQATEMDGVFVYSATKKLLVERKHIEEWYGIDVKQFVHWKALQGDKSDNVMGVPGIGPVRATKLFQKHGSLRKIVDAAVGDSTKMSERIRDFGLEAISKNVYVMSLKEDRTGARRDLVQKTATFEPADIKTFKNRIFVKGFTKLMDGIFYNQLRNLQIPRLSRSERTPVICERRYPVEV
jgi:5'-3' exonuclease